jgi:dihydroorotase
MIQNSSSGVLDYETFYPVFAEMEKQNMVLNLHGEVPSTPSHAPSSSSSSKEEGKEQQAITILNAEQSFLPTLLSLHNKFPNLRIILEHCSTAAALSAVRSCGPTVSLPHLRLLTPSFLSPTVPIPSH